MPAQHRIEAHTPTILLTGFGPFPSVPVNASQRLASLLARRARRRWPEAHIACATVPTEWRRGPDRLADLWQRLSPDIALHFGVSAKAIGLEIESTARNICADSADACGVRPLSAWHDEAGPDLCTSTLPAHAIVAALAARGIPGCISDDAGTYLCNGILYRSLRHAATADLPRAAKSHVSLRHDATAHLSPVHHTTPPHSHRPGAGRDPRKPAHFRTSAAALVGFIHIPACLVGGGSDGRSPLAGCPLDWNEALDGAMIALETTLAAR